MYNTNEIGSLLEISKEVGILTRYLSLKLNCFTDSRMYYWFGSNKKEFENIYSLEANFIILQKNLFTEIMMKAWVMCALDANCIAPHGAHIYGNIKNWVQGCLVCGCHRFDQDALSIVTSFFFSHPSSFRYKPAYAITSSEMFFFEIRRRNVFNYIFDQFKNAFYS